MKKIDCTPPPDHLMRAVLELGEAAFAASLRKTAHGTITEAGLRMVSKPARDEIVEVLSHAFLGLVAWEVELGTITEADLRMVSKPARDEIVEVLSHAFLQQKRMDGRRPQKADMATIRGILVRANHAAKVAGGARGLNMLRSAVGDVIKRLEGTQEEE